MPTVVHPAGSGWSVTTDTANGTLHGSTLQAAFVALGLSVTVQSVLSDADEFWVRLSATPSANDIAAMAAAVAAHSKPTRYALRSTAKVVNDEAALSGGGWSLLGGDVDDPAFHFTDLTKAIVRTRLAAKTTGPGAKVRLTQGATDLTPTPLTLPDTAGVWANFEFDSTVDMAGGLSELCIHGDLATASAASIRSAAISLLEVG